MRTQEGFLEKEWQPRLAEAETGKRHLCFVDAAHCVFGSFLCCLWSFVRLFVRAAAGRPRFNILGAFHAVTRARVSVTNTTVVNAETMCGLLRALAAKGLSGPVTLVLGLAQTLGIEWLYLPGYSPNLNLIERLWRLLKREALYGHYHATFADFKGAIEKTIGELDGKLKDKVASLMTRNFQVFKDVPLLAA